MEVSRTRRNLCGQVVDDLGCRILAGEVKPGESLPQEWTLCDQMRVSRTVIREAAKSLAAKGLVESRAKRGTIIRSARSWNYLDPEVLDWQRRADVDGRHLFHLTELRQIVEPPAAGMAAQRASDEQLQLILRACEEMEQAADSVEDFLAADIRFHVEILHATGNLLFAPIANVISASLESSLRLTNRQPTDHHASVPIHQKVTKATHHFRQHRNRPGFVAWASIATYCDVMHHTCTRSCIVLLADYPQDGLIRPYPSRADRHRANP